MDTNPRGLILYNPECSGDNTQHLALQDLELFGVSLRQIGQGQRSIREDRPQEYDLY